MTATRTIQPLDLPNLTPGGISSARPQFQWVAPTSLLVDEVYQRNLSRGSIELIRKIVARWDWNRFKPPVVAMTDEGLEVIDGQHTAIAAATHPEITEIPVMLAEAPRDAGGDEAEIKIVDVYICKLRKKLRPFSIEVVTVWGTGYQLTPASIVLLREKWGLSPILRARAA